MRTLLLLVLLSLAAVAEGFPEDILLPVSVSNGIYVQEISAILDAEGAYRAVIDWRMDWYDPRRAFPASRAGLEYREFNGPAVEPQLRSIWVPTVLLANLHTPERVLDRQLQIRSDGEVQYTRRLEAEFRSPIRTEDFPFDSQELEILMTCPEQSNRRLTLLCDQSSRNFSGCAQFELDGWSVGSPRFERGTFAHWDGVPHARMRALFSAVRQSGPYLTVLFIPIGAVLLVPLLSLWLNRWSGGNFVVEPFELMNVVAGGLFATVAMALAVHSMYPFLNSGHNFINQLFGLNYLLLAVAMLVILGLFKTQMGERPWFSAHVAHEIHRVLGWLLPSVTCLVVGGLICWAVT